MSAITKPVKPVKRAKSPIWGCPATAYKPKDKPPLRVLQLEAAGTSDNQVTKDLSIGFTSKTYLKVP
jgi:hypothetical protein